MLLPSFFIFICFLFNLLSLIDYHCKWFVKNMLKYGNFLRRIRAIESCVLSEETTPGHRPNLVVSVLSDFVENVECK